MNNKKIVFFASGNGSNVENIFNYFKNEKRLSIIKVYTNNNSAGDLKRIIPHGLNGKYFNKSDLSNGLLLKELKSLSPDLIILAGFLLKIPEEIIKSFPNKIINIHPALLPKYGGKGMFGINIHNAVKLNNDIKTGITIHYVNEQYDKGKIIFQEEVELSKKDTVETILKKVHKLEYEHFPKVINSILFKN